MEEILEYCGYNSAFSMLSDHMKQEELMQLLEDIVDSPADAQDYVKEEIENIASKTYEWVDRDAIIAQAEDMEYEKYRDGD
tara:strand:+ start:3466 stop:3708 length:243 start_codon:yes stop_codon:yes gene_type:complete